MYATIPSNLNYSYSGQPSFYRSQNHYYSNQSNQFNQNSFSQGSSYQSETYYASYNTKAQSNHPLPLSSTHYGGAQQKTQSNRKVQIIINKASQYPKQYSKPNDYKNYHCKSQYYNKDPCDKFPEEERNFKETFHKKSKKNFLEIPSEQGSTDSSRKESLDYHSDCSTQAGENDSDQQLKVAEDARTKKFSTKKQQGKLEQSRSDDDSYELATVKKPKKHFNSERERENFVRQYQMKFKTEMCRNYELTGKCYFQDTCSFAHGKHELMKKQHLPQNFKTKTCLQFHKTGFCPYGNRCQFLHSQYDIYNTDKKHSFNAVVYENVRLSMDRANLLNDGDEGLVYVNVFNTKRLSIFQSIIHSTK